MSNYTQITNFTAKDVLASGDPLKIIKGSDVDAEFAAIAKAIETKANSASPTLTGTVTITDATLAGNATISGAITASGGWTHSGTVTMSGKSIIEANASIAAHATTMDPWLLGNYVTLTGAAVTFTNMAAAPQAGAEVEIYMNAAHTFTDGAVFEVDGDANWTAEAGDRVLIRAKSTILFTVHPIKKIGSSVRGVVQVVNATYSTEATSSSSTWADSGLTATITPKSANSKILVLVSHAGIAKTTGNTQVGSRLLRTSTVILTFGMTDANTAAADTNGASSASGTYLDSPATTSATTYKTQFNSSANVATAKVHGDGATSTITLMEIAA